MPVVGVNALCVRGENTEMNDNRVKELEELVSKHQLAFYQIDELVRGCAGKEIDGVDFYPEWAYEVMKIAEQNR